MPYYYYSVRQWIVLGTFVLPNLPELERLIFAACEFYFNTSKALQTDGFTMADSLVSHGYWLFPWAFIANRNLRVIPPGDILANCIILLVSKEEFWGITVSRYFLIWLMRPMSWIENVFQYSSVVVALLLHSPVCSKWGQTKEEVRYVYSHSRWR